VVSFPRILDFKFTAEMETSLDGIEEGRENWITVLKNFYTGFEERLTKAKEEMRNLKQEEVPTDIDCKKCGKKMVIRWGRNGQFLACSSYPDCKTTSPFEKKEDGTIVPIGEKETDEKCPDCGAGMVIKTGRYGRFLACSAYPDCQFTKAVSIGVKCPLADCKGDLTERRTGRGKTFYGCTNYPKCNFATWDLPISIPCPQCKAPFLTKKTTRRFGVQFICIDKECGYKVSEDDWKLENPGVVVKSAGQ